jgi:hypothetical protein
MRPTPLTFITAQAGFSRRYLTATFEGTLTHTTLSALQFIMIVAELLVQATVFEF